VYRSESLHPIAEPTTHAKDKPSHQKETVVVRRGVAEF
jgi:hypothetical protein